MLEKSIEEYLWLGGFMLGTQPRRSTLDWYHSGKALKLFLLRGLHLPRECIES